MKIPLIAIAVIAFMGEPLSALPRVGMNWAIGSRTIGSTQEAGFVPHTNWNNGTTKVGSLSNLTNDAGASTTIDIMWSSGFNIGTDNGSGANGHTKLMTYWLDSGGGVTATLSEIPESWTYDLYVYMNRQGNAGTPITVDFTADDGSGPVTERIQDPGAGNNYPSPGYLEAATTSPFAGNYLVFNDLNGPTLSLTSAFVSGAINRTRLNGIQVVVTGIVPEPSTYLMLGSASAVAAFARRRMARTKR